MPISIYLGEGHSGTSCGQSGEESMVPATSQLAHLKPQDSVGWLFVGSCSILTGAAVGLSYASGPYAWVLGQVVLSVALLQWFVLLHEAGHCTLFRTRALNTLFAHTAQGISHKPVSAAIVNAKTTL